MLTKKRKRRRENKFYDDMIYDDEQYRMAEL